MVMCWLARRGRVPFEDVDDRIRIERYGLARRAVVVGGHALAFHGHPRFTNDLDIDPNPANAARLLEALADFGFGAVGLTVERSFGRPAARFMRMSDSSDAKRHSRPNTETASADRASQRRRRAAGRPARPPRHAPARPARRCRRRRWSVQEDRADRTESA